MSPFTQKMNQEIDLQMNNEFTSYQSNKQQIAESVNKINVLLTKMKQLKESVVIKVTGLNPSDIGIDKKRLIGEMQESMVLHSNIIEDIFNLKQVQEKMKVMLNGLVGILHHNLKFQNQYNLRPGKELDTYIAKEPSYNTINIEIRNVQNMIERSSELSGIMKQKIGFIRDLTKQRTQEMFSEK